MNIYSSTADNTWGDNQCIYILGYSGYHHQPINPAALHTTLSYSGTISHMMTPCTGRRNRAGVGVTKPISSVPLFSQILPIVKTHYSCLNIIFIFDRCWRSSAAVTPVKYESDSSNLTVTFARLKMWLTEKLTNGALVTPTSDVLHFTLHKLVPHTWYIRDSNLN